MMHAIRILKKIKEPKNDIEILVRQMASKFKGVDYFEIEHKTC